MLDGGPSCLPAHSAAQEYAEIDLNTGIAIERAVAAGKKVRLPLET